MSSPVASLPVLRFRTLHPRYVFSIFPAALSGGTEDCIHLCNVILNLHKYGTCLTPWVIMESRVQYAVGSLMLPTWEVGYPDSSTTSVFTASRTRLYTSRNKALTNRLSPTPCKRQARKRARGRNLFSRLPYERQPQISCTSCTCTKELFKFMQRAFQVGQPPDRPTRIKYT